MNNFRLIPIFPPQVSPRYKGELCGLCSEFDGEGLREFRGMDRCLYTDPIDFANSNVVKRSGNCPGTLQHGQRMCENSKFTDWKRRSGPKPQAGGTYLIVYTSL